ncbi:hypothetical protein BU16DRAFT_502560 [Lophium mytilinum]|uniref:T6SS Phospholipase effector Tle1-like catalytic domain-containing protein n=1 Tax=Lophium mytilinum TaxID=390894 RepID=A0A6A6R775_9PEZI|nr:hypothetical protein BU16DRAFT_502560 [Lophium mytilinum]
MDGSHHSRAPSRAPSRGPPPNRAVSRSRAAESRPPRNAEAGYKRLIVACDGTWLNADNGLINGKLSIPSNVTRISRAIRPVSMDGVPQIVYYHFGVGAKGGVVDRVVGGAIGEGVGENVREGYSFLCNNWAPGDEIFLIGFSRGAFTARSIGGLVGQIGLLTKKALGSLAEVFTDVQHRRDPHYRPKYPDVPFPDKPSADDPYYAEELGRRGLSRLNIPIKAIAVWDTVGSLGMPRIPLLTRLRLQDPESKHMAFYDTKLYNCTENAFQALALDERRAAFSPAVWEKPEGNRTTLRQVWFPGVHSNVGGGYDDQQLANITLAWMMAQLEPFLDMRMQYVLEQDEENEEYYRKHRERERPWSFGELYNSMSGIYAIGGGTTRTPGTYYAVDPDTGRATSRPLHDTHEYVHPSARTRLRLGGPGVDDKGVYECRALTDNWRLVVDYNNSAEVDVFWKLKNRDRKVSTRVLPEAPLWKLERELAMTDPKTYDYVIRPPPTGAKRKSGRRSSRVGSPVVEHGGRRSRVGSPMVDHGNGRRSRGPSPSVEYGNGVVLEEASALGVVRKNREGRRRRSLENVGPRGSRARSVEVDPDWGRRETPRSSKRMSHGGP